jgi:putative oxidoreductase
MLNPNITIKNLLQNPQVDAVISLIARLLIAYIFIVAGWGKITAYSATMGYMESKGVPGALLPLTILVELGGGLALLLGVQARLAALGLAVFSLMTALLFHGAAEDAINLMKNMAMTGGLLFLMLHGAGKFSVDYKIEKS